MPTFDAPLAPAGFELDEAAHTIRFTRRISAAPAQVFAAWTQPEQVSVWWDPDGEPLLRCDIDLRVGGGFSFVNRSHPDAALSGTYREITPPGRIVFEAMGAEGRVVMEAAGDGTTMTVEIVCANEAQLQQFVSMGIAAGTSRTMDNLVARFDAEPTARAAE